MDEQQQQDTALDTSRRAWLDRLGRFLVVLDDAEVAMVGRIAATLAWQRLQQQDATFRKFVGAHPEVGGEPN